LLLTKPGLLTKEFLSGRRARYVSPLRVYLVCSLLFFALAAFAPEAAQPFFRVTKADGEAGLDPAAVQRLRDAASRQASIAIIHDFPRAMFALMPAFGLLTWVLYRKVRPFYAAHLYYSIHFHAFMFFVLAVSLVIALGGGRYGRALGGLAPLPILVYHYTSLRRVFGGSRLQTAWKGTLLWFVYLVMVLAVMLGLGLRSLKTSGAPPAEHETHALSESRYGSRCRLPSYVVVSSNRI
jgi:hypothetical protein